MPARPPSSRCPAGDWQAASVSLAADIMTQSAAKLETQASSEMPMQIELAEGRSTGAICRDDRWVKDGMTDG